MKVARWERGIESVGEKSLDHSALAPFIFLYRTLFMYFFDILFECESLSLCGGELLNCLHESAKFAHPLLSRI